VPLNNFEVDVEIARTEENRHEERAVPNGDIVPYNVVRLGTQVAQKAHIHYLEKEEYCDEDI
jgi:hypothetical protein